MLRISSGPSGIARVQSATGQSNSGTTVTVTLGAAPTKGNLVVIALQVTNIRLMAITQSASIAWRWVIVENTTGGESLYLISGLVADSNATSSLVISIPTSAAAAVAAEYSGKNLAADRWTSASGNTASPASGTAGTPNYASELYLGALGCRGTWSATGTTIFSSPTNSFAIVGQANTNINTTNSDRAACLLEKFATTTGDSYNAGATITSAQWAAQVTTFNECPLAPPNAFIE